jgi:uncharacterized protein (TIGR02996 family)
MSAMTDREMLLAAICANPDEDTPRLAFADWLQEQGGKENTFRADYIRAAIRLAREELWSPAWQKAEKAWDKLEMRVGQRKLAWTSHLQGRVVESEFDRGFIGHITVYSKRFVAEGEQFFVQDPIRSLKFVTLAATRGTVPVKELFACPHLARVAKLRMDDSRLKDSDLATIGASRQLARLRSISLSGAQNCTPKGFVKLLQELPSLSELLMESSTRFVDNFAETLAGSPALGKLTSLDLAPHHSSKGLAALLTSKHVGNLQQLKLALGYGFEGAEDEPAGSLQLQAKDGKVIAEALGKSRFPKLKFLELGACEIGDAGLEAIVTGGGFPSLRQLSLYGNDLTQEGLKILANADVGKQLVYLSVGSSPQLENPKVMKEVCAMFPNARVEGDEIC